MSKTDKEQEIKKIVVSILKQGPCKPSVLAEKVLQQLKPDIDHVIWYMLDRNDIRLDKNCDLVLYEEESNYYLIECVRVDTIASTC